MMFDIADLEKNYAGFSDEKIIRLATEEVASLRPEAVEILRKELRVRGLSEKIGEGISVQLKPLTEEELFLYVNLIETLPCPVCNSNSEHLNAIQISEVVSFFVITSHKKTLKIACPVCLNKSLDQATIKTLFLGWWGFPNGLIQSIKGLDLNAKTKKALMFKQNNNLLREFAAQNAGILETYKSDKNKLLNIILNA